MSRRLCPLCLGVGQVFTGSPSHPYLTASTPAKPECLKPLQKQEAPGTDLEGPAHLFPEHGSLQSCFLSHVPAPAAVTPHFVLASAVVSR